MPLFRKFTFINLYTACASLLLAACHSATAPAPPACDNGRIQIAPTATRPADPDLFSPPGPPPDGGNGATYCPTPVPVVSPPVTPPSQFVAAEVVNLSLDVASQTVAATAVGDDMLAVAWITQTGGGSDIYVALSRGGNHFQVRQVDKGSRVSMAFSRANRLHVAYEQDGRILYRAADQGTHPAEVFPIFVAYGQAPQVVVDELNWAHVLYEQGGRIYKAKHLSNDAWLAQFVADGVNPMVMPFYNEEELVLFGIPTGTSWFGILLAAPHNGQIRLFRYLSWFNLWEQVASFPIPPGEALAGPIGLDYKAAGQSQAWAYAAWVTKRPNPHPPLPRYTQPIFEAVNPLYPDQIANPGHIYQGLNAVRWRTGGSPFSAGLKQTIPIPDPGRSVSFEAWGLAEAAAGADMSLRIGIDPTGGDNPDSANVVWSAAAAPGRFTRFAVSAPAGGATATLFLHATLNTPDVPGTAVWDGAAVQNGELVNGGFEGAFLTQSTLVVPEGWTATYRDSGNAPINGRDAYTIYAAWSDNGGSDWTGPETITANRDTSLSAGLGGGATGAIQPEVHPLISTSTRPPSVSFFYIYETGDPPPGTDFLRFGRPTMTMCDLGTTNCTDAPGAPLLPRNVTRPSYHLLAAPDPFNSDRAILVWDSLQTDVVSRDVYITYVAAR